MGVRLNDSANGRIVESKAFSNGIKKAPVERVCKCLIFKLWAQLGLNQRPPDYEKPKFSYYLVSSLYNSLKNKQLIILTFIFFCNLLHTFLRYVSA